MASPILRGGDLRIAQDGHGIGEVIRLVINPIWNAYYFFTLYANADGMQASLRADSEHLLDRYLLAKTRALIEGVTAAMDAYDVAGACAQVLAFTDALNNWYIRSSRERFWGSKGEASEQDAYDTLYTVLVNLCRVAAPLLPLITEEIHRGLTGQDSVHLAPWPDSESLPSDPLLVADMDRVRDVCSTALALREDHRLRTRLPLASLTLAGHDSERLAPLAHLVRNEVNVKAVQFSEDLEAHGHFVLQPNGRTLGPKLGPAMRDVMQAARSGDWTRNEDGTVTVVGQTLAAEEFELRLKPKEGEASQALRTNDAVVVLDVAVTPELEAEGIARDLVRKIQQARKEAGFQVSDRIDVTLDLPEAAVEAVHAWEAYVAEQVLAVSITYGAPADGAHIVETGLADGTVTLGIRVSAG